jgi:hypothetical protein
MGEEISLREDSAKRFQHLLTATHPHQPVMNDCDARGSPAAVSLDVLNRIYLHFLTFTNKSDGSMAGGLSL